MSNHSGRTHAATGFTLIEMLVVIGILSVAGIALSTMIQSFYKNNAFLLEQTAALDSARRGVREAVSNIRESSYADNGAYPIETAATSTLTFYSDFDRDASVERVTYVLQNGTLYRVVTNASGYTYTGAQSTTTVASFVRNDATAPLFTYYDTAGVQLSTSSPNIASIASVGISLYIDLNPNRAPNVFNLRQTATLRNLRPVQ